MPPVHYQLGSFPPKRLDWARLVPKLGPTAAAVARYDGMLAAVPNPAVLLSPLTTQEAVLSSKIEGTQATMGEVLEFEAGEEAQNSERREDIREIQNYRSAMRKAGQLLGKLPLCGRVLLEAHRVLLGSVRGQNKGPGAYRKGANWIGRQGSTVETARFVPPAPDRIGDLMATWERYAHSDAEDRLVQIAILHAEFEAIHPFADGNGRLGRMIVPLHLWQIKQISKPMFYVSGYLEAHRDAYYDGLLGVSRDGDWTGWCEFFLDALRAQAEENLKKTRAILALHASMAEQLADLTRSQHASRALAWIFAKPVFRSSDFARSSKIPTPTAHRFLTVLRDAGVLKTVKTSRGKLAAVLAFPALVNIVEGRKVF